MSRGTKEVKFDKTPMGIKYGKLQKPLKFKPISKVRKDEKFLSTLGKVFKIETRVTKNGSTEYAVFIVDTNYKDSLMVKMYAGNKKEKEQLEKIQKGQWILFQGYTKMDTYMKNEVYLNAYAFQQLKGFPEKVDETEEKRVELHLHTKMSKEYSIVEPSTLIDDVMKMGYNTVAITDLDCSHAFPMLYNKLKDKEDFKVIYGAEFSVINDDSNLINKTNENFYKDKTFVVFDIETTGLDVRKDKIIEIGAVKVRNGEILEEFHSLINPNEELSKEIIKLTGIKNKMLENAPTIDEVLPKFIEFISDFPLVAHNINFDGNFINAQCHKNGIELPKNSWIDTLEIARRKLPLDNHKLETLVNYFKIKLDNHHRAVDDAKATMEIFYKLLETEKEIKYFNTLVYIKNNEGRKRFNRIISNAHVEFLDAVNKQQQISFDELLKDRENLIIVPSGNEGEIFYSLVFEDEEKATERAKKYDYLEVLPVEQYINYDFIINDTSYIKNIISQIIKIGEKLNIPVVANGNVSYLNEEEKEIRDSLFNTKQYVDMPKSHFRTTEEMLEEFNFLGEEKAYEIVVKNTNLFADKIEKVQILPDELMIPRVEKAEKEIIEVSEKRLKELYGENPHPIVKERYERELNAILGRNGNSDINYSVLYWIAYTIVKKSNELGYMVGSRGSVGSSFLAYLLNITEVNSLAPHYVCPNCHHIEFPEKATNGVILPNKKCPHCDTEMHKDGMNIPFETFVGIGRVKLPDIDLNFSSEIQSIIHEYIAELFGIEFVYKAGTISTIKEKAIEKIVKDNFNSNVTKSKYHLFAETKRFSLLEGVKKTTGQHAGGIIIFPKEIEPLDWIPIQYSANDVTKPLTTHYDYRSLEECFIKIDALGHDSPTIAKMYEDALGIDYSKIPLNDEKVINTFFREKTNNGISEFLTPFVEGMLAQIKPKNFEDLVRISGLSHGTNVWFGNAKTLIENGEKTIEEVIACRDDIMLDLMSKGIPEDIAYKITDKVRKGKGIDEEYIPLLKEHGVEDWYIQSCNKIKYLFPKAHAVAYTINSVKQAWVKYYHPEVFFATFFSTKTDGFKWETVGETIESLLGIIDKEQLNLVLEKYKDNQFLINEIIKQNTVNLYPIEYRISELDYLRKGMVLEDDEFIESEDAVYRADDKMEYLLLRALKEAIEMGIKIGKVDLLKSHPTQFVFDGKKIVPPLCTIKFIGKNSAKKFADFREKTNINSFSNLYVKEDKEDILIDKRALLHLIKYGNIKELFKKEEIMEFIEFMETNYSKKDDTVAIKEIKLLIKEIKKNL